MRVTPRLLLVIFISFFACESKDDVKSFLEVDVSDFNERIDKGIQISESWVKTPYLIVNEFFGPSYNSEGHQIFTLEQYENEGLLTVIVTQEGLLDDSVAGEKRIIDFKFENGVWKIIRIRLGMKCYEYRGGHTNYSGDLCS